MLPEPTPVKREFHSFEGESWKLAEKKLEESSSSEGDSSDSEGDAEQDADFVSFF